MSMTNTYPENLIRKRRGALIDYTNRVSTHPVHEIKVQWSKCESSEISMIEKWNLFERETRKHHYSRGKMPMGNVNFN